MTISFEVVLLVQEFTASVEHHDLERSGKIYFSMVDSMSNQITEVCVEAKVGTEEHVEEDLDLEDHDVEEGFTAEVSLSNNVSAGISFDPLFNPNMNSYPLMRKSPTKPLLTQTIHFSLNHQFF